MSHPPYYFQRKLANSNDRSRLTRYIRNRLSQRLRQFITAHYLLVSAAKSRTADAEPANAHHVKDIDRLDGCRSAVTKEHVKVL